MPVKDNRAPTLRMRLHNVSPQANTATFTLTNEDGEPMGKLILYYRKIIDQSKKMGSEGYIKFPKEHHFPDRFVIKMHKPDGL